MNASGTITVEADVHFSNGHRGRKRAVAGEKPAPPLVPNGAVPRLSRLMALAIRFDGLLREGVVKDYAELARLGQVSRARLTQIMNLLNLAPDIQEEILFLPLVAGEREAISERQVRKVAAIAGWREQSNAWQELTHEEAVMDSIPSAAPIVGQGQDKGRIYTKCSAGPKLTCAT